MGNLCNGKNLSPEEKEAKLRTRRIEDLTKQMFQKDAQKIKLLLLGAGESGKSTLFKQMKILYGSAAVQQQGARAGAGFSEEERMNMKLVVHQNILFNFKQLLFSPLLGFTGRNNNAGSETLCEELSAQNRKVCERLLQYSTKNLEEITPIFARELLQLWSDPIIERVWQNRGNLQVQDALEYYLEERNLARIAGVDMEDFANPALSTFSLKEYLPNDQDILRSRVRTSGIMEEQFEMDGNRFVMVDVGGQRNERRKWIHAFEDVDCVLFVAAISEYNQVLYEDTKVKRQDESVQLFHKIANEKCFQSNGLVLFLNKCDLLRKKLLMIPFRLDASAEETVLDASKQRNLDYTGPVLDPNSEEVKRMTQEDFEASDLFNEIYIQSLQYLEQLYRKQVPPGKEVYVKVTCATDTQQVQHIMTACRDIFLRKNLKNTGFM